MLSVSKSGFAQATISWFVVERRHLLSTDTGLYSNNSAKCGTSNAQLHGSVCCWCGDWEQCQRASNCQAVQSTHYLRSWQSNVTHVSFGPWQARQPLWAWITLVALHSVRFRLRRQSGRWSKKKRESTVIRMLQRPFTANPHKQLQSFRLCQQNIPHTKRGTFFSSLFLPVNTRSSYFTVSPLIILFPLRHFHGELPSYLCAPVPQLWGQAYSVSYLPVHTVTFFPRRPRTPFSPLSPFCAGTPGRPTSPCNRDVNTQPPCHTVTFQTIFD